MILFASCRPLERAENIKALWEAYDGEKDFIQMDGKRNNDELAGDYDLLVTDEFVTKSSGKCIMLGHGIAGGKTYGLDQPDPYHNMNDAKLLTWVVTSSRYVLGMVAKQCGVTIDRVLPLGVPRTDAYFGAEKRETDKRIYLYAPTFRKFYEGEDPILTTDFKKLDELLTDDEVFIVKAHMMMDDPEMEYKHIVVAPKDIPSKDYLINCDVLVTDYSSIMFDAYVLDKPVVLFAKDKDDYLWNRGMYFRYPSAYGRFCNNEEDLVRTLREAEKPTDAERLTKALTCEMCDGRSTERVLGLIKSMEGNK